MHLITGLHFGYHSSLFYKGLDVSSLFFATYRLKPENGNWFSNRWVAAEAGVFFFFLLPELERHYEVYILYL